MNETLLEQFDKKCNEIATLLNGRSNAPTASNRREILPDRGFYHKDAVVHVVLRDGRLEFTGGWPKSRMDSTLVVPFHPAQISEPSLSISVALTKTAEQIVADLRRRFLPRYLDIFNKLIAHREQVESFRRNQVMLLETLRRLSGHPCQHCSNVVVFPKGRAEVHGPDYVSFSVNLNREESEAMMKFLGTLPSRG